LCDEGKARTGEIADLVDRKPRAAGERSSSQRPSSHPLAGGITKTIEDALRAAGLM
jgi:hypothetical protein